MFNAIVEGFFLGLATGSTCLVTCTPIYLPYLLAEERNLKKSLLAVLEISAGRFFSYLAFGALAGFAGTQITSINRTLFTSIAYILLSIYLVLSVVRTHRKSKKCHVPKAVMLTKSAFILGILTGINFCPSFLIALSKAINLGGIFSGMELFLGFFFGTTIFLLPIAFVGGLSKIKQFGFAAKIASILVAIWFTFAGVQGLVKYYNPPEINMSGRTVEAFIPKQPLTIIYTVQNQDYFTQLKTKIDEMHNGDVTILKITELDSLSAPIYLIDQSIIKEQKTRFIGVDYFSIEAEYPIDKMLKFMNSYVFRTDDHLHWEFTSDHDH